MENDNKQFPTRFRVSQFNTPVGYTHVLCCPCCMFFTLSFANFHKHALTHEVSQLSSYRTYTCSKCQSTSTEKYLMLEHVNIYHRNAEKPVELTEEIHTILRKSEEKDENHSRKISPSRRPNTESSIFSPKMEKKKRIISSSFKKFSKIHQKYKIKSQLKKYSSSITKKSLNELFTHRGGTSKSFVKKYGTKPENDIFNENEPVDMTIKNVLKNDKTLTNEKILADTEMKFNHDYSASYQNIRSYLYDVLSKNPLPTGLSQSLMLRYLTAQFQSLQAAKYFSSNAFMGQPSVLTQQDKAFQQRIFQTPPSMAIPKGPDGNSINQRNLHRNNFSPFQNHILLEWYDNHKQKPYPSTEETKHLATLCGLSYPQVKKWFANKRARSSFYQKNDVATYQSQPKYNLLRFPLQISNRLNSEVVKTIDSQFGNSIENLAMVSSSSHDDSILST